ncbi:MAG: amphi-Trp domain-containing protein [Myxococcales bacterium]|jgi:amphi-Trp domain-containing protein
MPEIESQTESQTESQEETSHLSAVESQQEQEAEQEEEKKSSKIKFHSDMARDEAVAYFEAIVQGLKRGALQFRRGEEHLDLSPPERLSVKVKAASKGDKEKVEFELSWSTEEPAPEEDLEIS